MKLLGVEFRDFACFDLQFVPIRTGMNLLVGRNNAGKTALLRGLSALSALPFSSPRPQIPADLTGYLHAGAKEVPFDVVCGIDESDGSFFEGVAPERWAVIMKEGLARWKFAAVTESRQVSFTRCIFVIPDPRGIQKEVEVSVIETDSAGVAAKRIRYPDIAAFHGARITLHGLAAGGPMVDFFNQRKPFASPFVQLQNVKLISPHRVVVQRQTLQTALDLPSDGQNLPQFLMTLHGRDRDTFEAIEKFVVKVFPEFKHVNPVAGANNNVFIDLTESRTNRKIALENCGTGVEQILALATFVLTTPKPGVVLLDEPHSYLHPTAERALVRFLGEHAEHSYIISTHSAVLMNSVEPDRITHVSPLGRGYSRSEDAPETSRILFDLGYRNSDAMFSDQLILVEGPSDEKIMPILLLKDGEIDQGLLDRTGFPVLEGVGKGTTALQTSILRYEKLLGAIGRGNQPRMYVFDGDRKNDEKGVLLGTASPVTGEPISAVFLPRLEVENYLLIPEAIAGAVREELILKGEPREVTAAEVQAALDALLQGNEERMFPQGKKAGAEPIAEIKGSRALEKIYERYGLPYHKERSGVLIAKYISAKNQPALSEVTGLVRPLFARQ
jgi:AAA domain, putative AbiEii toxin, Type IV TA system